MPSPNEFTDVYARHARMVYNLCLNHLRNSDDAAEATQDVFLKVHEKLPGFQGVSTLRTWIYRIAINTCLDRIKAAKRRKRSFLGIPFSVGTVEVVREIAVFDHPGVQMEQREVMAQVFACMDRLPENQRTALLLKAAEGLSQNEIAEVMGLSAKAVESLLSRARSNLEKILAPAKGSNP